MTLVELKKQFLEYLKTERGRSEKTLENYNRYLECFLIFTKLTKATDITDEQVYKFQQYLKHQPGTKVGGKYKPMKQRTQNYYLIALRVFLKFLRQRDISSLSPARVELTKVTTHSVDLISALELKQLVDEPDTKELVGKRDKAILELLFSTGLRISELCNLSIDNVDLTHDELSVRGKGDRVRVVFLSDSARKSLQNYLQHRKDLDQAMFVRYGRKMNYGGDPRLSPRAVQRLLKKYSTQVGIARKITPQVIRHSFAISLLSNGTDLHSVQQLLGHSNLSTTQIYTHVTDKHLR